MAENRAVAVFESGVKTKGGGICGRCPFKWGGGKKKNKQAGRRKNRPAC